MQKYILTFITLVLLMAFSYEVKSQTLQILPLGNSITQASNVYQSYRYPLWKKLLDDGLDFNFVGSHTQHYLCGTPTFPDYLGQSFDMDHEGHWGWRCDEVLQGDGSSAGCRGSGSLSDWLATYTPDIALVHLGTNDMFQSTGGTGAINITIGELKAIVDTLRADNPNMIILLALLIPTSDPDHSWKIPLINAQIPQIAIDKYDPNSPIIIVDQFTGYDPVADNQSDGVHPNASGEEKMAQKWRDAIIDALTGINVDVNIMLEGPFNGTNMNTQINADLPLDQPFDGTPWNYPGLESVTTVPGDMVDWVLLELRDATDAASATESTIIAQKACFVNADGKIVNLDGSEEVRFAVEITEDLFVVVHQRNHLYIMSASALTEAGGVYNWDFTTDVTQAFGGSLALKAGGGGVALMVAGDVNADGVINALDRSAYWSPEAGSNGYNASDLNLDGQVDNLDKNDLWRINEGSSSQVPIAK
jgi:lysophospholipase L1-like esterase